MFRNNPGMPDTGHAKWLFGLAACLFLLSGAVIAAPAEPSQTETEIVHLLDFVEQSDCQFNRNDNWYNGKQARLHLENKYDFLVMRGVIGKAEDSIAKAASKSSLSGRPYRIRCVDEKTVSSAQWLTGELQRFRKHRNKK